MVSITQVKPKADESYEGFIIRAHGDLIDLIPDFEERNRYVWDAWEDARGEQPEAAVMRRKFSDGYKVEPNVCYFDEHDLPLKDGGKYSVGVDDLAAICRANNLRIADVAAASPIIERHTLSKKERMELDSEAASTEPDILGYAGPYRIGMVGNVKPRFAIFADERHRLDKQAKLNARPRRSVEWVRFKDGTSYLDPIAALGGDSPRLPLPPAHYSAPSDSDAEIVRYSVASPAYAGGSNTYAPSFSAGEKRRYTSEDPQCGQEQDSMLQEQDVLAIVDALKKTPEFVWIQGEMAKAKASGVVPASDDDGTEDDLELNDDAKDATKVDPSVEPFPAKKFAAADGEGVDIERFQAAYIAQNEEIASLRKEMGQFKREKSDAVRLQQLHELKAKFPTIDLALESSKCLYSAGSQMDDSAFQERLATIEHYAALSGPRSSMVPAGVVEDENDVPETEKYSAEVRAEVLRRSNEFASQRKFVKYSDIERQVIAERQQSK